MLHAGLVETQREPLLYALPAKVLPKGRSMFRNFLHFFFFKKKVSFSSYFHNLKKRIKYFPKVSQRFSEVTFTTRTSNSLNIEFFKAVEGTDRVCAACGACGDHEGAAAVLATRQGSS